MRWGFLGFMALVACTSEAQSGIATFGPGAPSQADSGDGEDDDAPAADDDDDDAADSSSSGGEVGTTGGTTADPAESSGVTDPGDTVGEESGGEDGETGAVDGQQPEDGMWSHCLNQSDCDGMYGCLGLSDMSDGHCTEPCAPAGNPASCGPSPGGTAAVSCIAAVGTSICALDCSGGRTCPGGMVCVSDVDDNGPIEICM